MAIIEYPPDSKSTLYAETHSASIEVAHSKVYRVKLQTQSMRRPSGRPVMERNRRKKQVARRQQTWPGTFLVVVT